MDAKKKIDVTNAVERTHRGYVTSVFLKEIYEDTMLLILI